jgi:multidrug efflux pump subunit AcrA (membrane-fusion protein)
LFDIGVNFLRTQLASIQGAQIPYPYGGKQPQIQVDLNPEGTVAVRPVTLGRDFGNSVEVVSGLTGDEQIVVDPPDSIENGETVRVAAPGTHEE